MRIIYLLILALLCKSLLSQNISYGDFRNAESICYCNTTTSTPESIVGIDNNWEIIQFLVHPKTRSQLDSAGIKYTISQLKLLTDWSLISNTDDSIYQTQIPVIDSLNTAKLRKYSLKLSEKLSISLIDDINKLKEELTTLGRNGSIFSILFSYMLDGMVWDYLDDDSLLPNNEITIGRPYWNGEFWITYPKRQFSCGTNAISDSGYSIKVNWNEKAIPHMLPFVTRWDLLGKMLNDLISKGRIEDKETIEVFGQYKLFDANGNFTVPIINENDSNTIYKISQSISRKTESFLKNNVDFEYLGNEFAFKSKSQSIIILYHEMLWDVIDILDSDKIIKKPESFTNPDNTKPEDISNLVFITKKSKY